MKEQIHLAAQYLAAAGISFVIPKNDDSHTNLGFNVDAKSLETRQLSSERDVLAFNYEQFSLEWHSFSKKKMFKLDGKTHQEVLQWLKETSLKCIGKSYKYDLHYDLPYSIDDDYTFKLKDIDELKYLSSLRILIQQTLEQIIKDYHLETEIRVWPHHFDTGIYTAFRVNNNDTSSQESIHIGLGLAIPDRLCNKHYFYISGYAKDKAISTTNFQNLDQGVWIDDNFKGAILSTEKGVSKSDVIEFFREAIKQFTRID
ncbi:hypothetical protein [Aquimarina algicola]|uniref:Uncharacterized protein n=1 Tax=Aquimarina algicola TaxID=2589995 RepID=A0A504IY35_9FLAO|nr:hypothetical protein [Aquimarina algicola]TPN83387.1 hypothetical protein FHK87_19390 [Aquimarina algicola]